MFSKRPAHFYQIVFSVHATDLFGVKMSPRMMNKLASIFSEIGHSFGDRSILDGRIRVRNLVQDGPNPPAPPRRSCTDRLTVHLGPN